MFELLWSDLSEVRGGKDVASTYVLHPHLVEQSSYFEMKLEG